jgi:hypothetical protein
MKPPKIIQDTLQDAKGKWAHKRVLSFSSFWFGVLYSFAPTLYPAFEVHEFVVLCAFGLSAGALGIDLQQKIKVQDEYPDNTYINNQVNNETIG